MTTINILCGLGEYPVDIPSGLTVNDIPQLLASAGGIVVPIEVTDGERGISDTLVDNLFIPASQIQGITWASAALVGDMTADDADVAEVSYIGEEEPTVPTGPNGEIFIDG